jgi:hypothetical protein
MLLRAFLKNSRTFQPEIFRLNSVPRHEYPAPWRHTKTFSNMISSGGSTQYPYHIKICVKKIRSGYGVCLSFKRELYIPSTTTATVKTEVMNTRKAYNKATNFPKYQHRHLNIDNGHYLVRRNDRRMGVYSSQYEFLNYVHLSYKTNNHIQYRCKGSQHQATVHCEG